MEKYQKGILTYDIPGIDTPVPVQFYIPEEFDGKEKLIEKIENSGGAVVSKITSLTHQITHIKNVKKLKKKEMVNIFYNGIIFGVSLIEDSLKQGKFLWPYEYRVYKINNSKLKLPNRYGEFWKLDEIARVLIEIPAKPNSQYRKENLLKALSWLPGRTLDALHSFINSYCQSEIKREWLENIFKLRSINQDELITYTLIFPKQLKKGEDTETDYSEIIKEFIEQEGDDIRQEASKYFNSELKEYIKRKESDIAFRRTGIDDTMEKDYRNQRTPDFYNANEQSPTKQLESYDSEQIAESSEESEYDIYSNQRTSTQNQKRKYNEISGFKDDSIFKSPMFSKRRQV